MSIVHGSTSKKHRVFVLGIDGVSFSLMREFLSGDLLPCFAETLGQGGFKRMNSVFPTVSSVAWASYMTGVNPGKHNIFGFLDRVPQTMEMVIPTSTHMAGKTLWEWLSRHGKRVVVVNVPVTYPPRPVNGVIVAGFLCPSIDRISYPREVARDLKGMGYRIDIDSWKARESTDGFLADVDDALNKRFEAAFNLMERVDWDFFQLHIIETDRVNHFLLKRWKEKDPIYGPLFLRFYQKLDRFLAILKKNIGDGTDLVILSDHGFCVLRKEVFLNHWLEREGFLKMKRVSESLVDIRHDSTAYALYPGRIYVNLKGREATGTVEGGQEYERVRENLTQGLLGIRDPETGDSMMKCVLRREEIFNGPYLGAAPDLVAIPREGYDLKGQFTRPTLAAKSPVEGMHTYEDALIYVRNREIQKEGNGFGIMDAHSVVLDLMNLPKPPGLEAQSLI
jgi:predicted AlkP superfamily phosphohydrolase/phosphomutase